MITHATRLPAAFASNRSLGVIAPAAQAMQTNALPAATQTLAAIQPIAPAAPDSCPHCPSLPSSESAFEFINGNPGAFFRVLRDMVLRGALIGTGIWVYDKATGREDPVLLQRAIAGAAGIEVFVLAWTWWNKPKAQVNHV